MCILLYIDYVVAYIIRGGLYIPRMEKYLTVCSQAKKALSFFEAPPTLCTFFPKHLSFG